MILRLVILLCGSGLAAGAVPPPLDWIGLAKDSAGFARVASGERFVPWGFNYDHDEAMRLIEDYWEGEWAKVESDLMNEPVVPGLARPAGDWLGPPFTGKHFVQFITLDPAQRPRPEIARRWIQKLVAAIRSHDRRHLITVGLVDWSLNRPGLTSGFEPDRIAADLDFVSVHLYPEESKVEAALQTLGGFAVGKPVLIEETFPLRCRLPTFERFIRQSAPPAAGWVGFYWGRTIEEYQGLPSPGIGDGLTLGWLELFRKLAPARFESARPGGGP